MSKKIKNKIITLIIGTTALTLIVYGGYRWYQWKTTPGQFDSFAKCLSGKEIKMYGTNWCKYCQKQKKKFGKSFKRIDFVNCDYDQQKCSDNDIQGYPTWIINGEKYPGVQPLERLASLSGCELLDSSGTEKGVQENTQDTVSQETTAETKETETDEEDAEEVKEFEVEAFRF